MKMPACLLNVLSLRSLLLAVALEGSVPALADEVRDPSCLEVVVGITPNCPYGMKSCWPNAKAALEKLSQVHRINDVDYYNCTARLEMKEPGLPDVAKLQGQFAAIVGGNYGFRGVELTLRGSLEMKDGTLRLTSDTPALSIPLARLEHKLQWNYQKQRARGPEDVESVAHQELKDKVTAAGPGKVKAMVTGPLHASASGTVLEVREYFLLEAATY